MTYRTHRSFTRHLIKCAAGALTVLLLSLTAAAPVLASGLTTTEGAAQMQEASPAVPAESQAALAESQAVPAESQAVPAENQAAAVESQAARGEIGPGIDMAPEGTGSLGQWTSSARLERILGPGEDPEHPRFYNIVNGKIQGIVVR